MVNIFDLQTDAERHLYAACYRHIEDGDTDVLYYLVTDNKRSFVADSLLEIEHIFRAHRETLNQTFAAYTAFAYGTHLPYAERDLNLSEALTLKVVRLSTTVLEDTARAYDALETPPDEPFETLGDVWRLLEDRFQHNHITDMVFIEDEEEGEYHVVRNERDAVDWLERHARDANLSDDAITSNYWVHHVSRNGDTPRKFWHVAKTRPHVSRRIDIDLSR